MFTSFQSPHLQHLQVAEAHCWPERSRSCSRPARNHFSCWWFFTMFFWRTGQRWTSGIQWELNRVLRCILLLSEVGEWGTSLCCWHQRWQLQNRFSSEQGCRVERFRTHKACRVTVYPSILVVVACNRCYMPPWVTRTWETWKTISNTFNQVHQYEAPGSLATKPLQCFCLKRPNVSPTPSAIIFDGDALESAYGKAVRVESGCLSLWKKMPGKRMSTVAARKMIRMCRIVIFQTSYQISSLLQPSYVTQFSLSSQTWCQK